MLKSALALFGSAAKPVFKGFVVLLMLVVFVFSFPKNIFTEVPCIPGYCFLAGV
jgi:hypothetical protein